MGCASVVNHSNSNTEIFEPQLRTRQSNRATYFKEDSIQESPLLFPLTLPDGFGKYRRNHRNQTIVRLRNTNKEEISLNHSENKILKRKTTEEQ